MWWLPVLRKIATKAGSIGAKPYSCTKNVMIDPSTTKNISGQFRGKDRGTEKWEERGGEKDVDIQEKVWRTQIINQIKDS